MRRQPAHDLEAMGRVADHHEQNRADQDAGTYEHALEGQPRLEFDGHEAHRHDEDCADGHALHHRPQATFEYEGLQKEHRLETLPVHAGKAQEHEANDLAGRTLPISAFLRA